MTQASSGQRIIVGVDGSEESKQALRWADHLAKLTGSSLTAVAAWEPFSSFAWASFGAVAVPTDWPAEAARAGLDSAIAEVFAEPASSIETRVIEGNPAKVLVQVSADALMLVVGSRGVGGFTGLLLGSVSSSCAEHASCPVFVVHGKNPPTE